MLEQAVRGKGLGKNLERCLAALHQFGRFRVAGKQNDTAGWALLQDHGRGINAVQIAEHYIENRDVGKESGGQCDGLFTRVDRRRFVSSRLQDASESVCDIGLVVCDKNPLTLRHE